MTEQPYSVTFEGDVGEGRDPEAVKKELSSLGILSPADIEQILSGKSVVLQSGLTHDQALRYQAALEAAGATSRVIPSSEETSSATDARMGAAIEAPGQSTLGAVSSDDLTLAPAPKELEIRMTCPKCGLDQVEANECAACGVIVSKFTQRQESGEEAPWESADSDRADHQMHRGDIYEGQIHGESSGQAAQPSGSSLQGLSWPEMVEFLKSIPASVVRMLLTAARLTAGFLYRQSRRGLAWIAQWIRSRAKR